LESALTADGARREFGALTIDWEVPMREMRRRLVMGLAASIFLAAGAELLFAQRHAHRPTLQQQLGLPPSLRGDNNATQPVKAAVLLQNEKEFRESVEQLYRLVNELKEEVEKTPTTAVLSARMYKRAHEIEKLAKQIKNKVKG
jgi:hypothetical protein